MNKELIVANRPKSGLSEALKIVRTNLQFASVDQKLQNLLVTSSIPGEGKSFISANLAVAFSLIGCKVLIVDCDLRRGRQHEIFNIDNEKGLSNLLIDDVKTNYNNYIKETSVKNVSVLPRGVVPPNPTKLLSSDKMKSVVENLEKKYDLIIYDGTPVGGLADSLIMADIVDKVIIVCAYKVTPMKYLENTKRSLDKFKDKVAGVIVNQMPSKKNHYYNNYYS